METRSLIKTLTPEVFWLETFLNPPECSSALLETCPYIVHMYITCIFINAPCIFNDLSYSALVDLYFLPGSNFAPFEEVNVPVSNSADFFQKKVGGFWKIWGG